MTIAFISPHSMASPNCRREINFALSKQKPFLSVVLEPTKMPLGMELQLSAQQSVIRYNYRTNAKFIEKICSCPDLVCCQEIPVQQEPEQAEPAQIELSENPELTDLTKLQGLSSLSQLNISGTGVSSLAPVPSEKLYRIYFSQTPVSDISPLAQCSGLYEVNGSGSAATDLSPLAGLIDLNVINFAGCDLSEMGTDTTFFCLRLSTLNLSATGITDLKPFENMTRLTAAYIGYNNLDNEDLQFLSKSAETLKTLDISETQFIGHTESDSKWLAECPNIDYSNMSGITGNYISLTYFDGISDSYFNTKPFSWYYITNCPDDQKVAIEDLLGSYNVDFVEPGWELINMMETEFDMDCTYLRCSACNGSGITEDKQNCPLCAGSGLY